LAAIGMELRPSQDLPGQKPERRFAVGGRVIGLGEE